MAPSSFPRSGASSRARAVHFASQHLALLRLHQLTVDAYGAQHGGGGVPPIRLTYSLVGLYLAVEHGLTGDDVRSAHQRISAWASPPVFPAPQSIGPITVLTVAEEGLMDSSKAGHSAAVQRWAEEVWRAWPNEHDAVAALTQRLLPNLVPR